MLCCIDTIHKCIHQYQGFWALVYGLGLKAKSFGLDFEAEVLGIGLATNVLYLVALFTSLISFL